MHYRLPHPDQGILGPALAIYASQATTLQSAFNTMPLSDDLYPVTKPSTSPTAFLSTSASTWNQRLRHFGDQIIGSLNNEFDMTDLEELNYFLGISANRTPIGLFLSQKKYALQLLERAHMVTCNPSRTPVDTESKLGPEGYLYVSFTTSLVGYTNADWAGCPSTRRSTSAETAWLRNLIRELHSPLSTATLVYYDNVSVVYMSANPVQHQRMKHIEIDIHFIRDMVTASQAYSQMYNGMFRHLGVRHIMIYEMITNRVVSIEFVRSQQNLDDHLTKGLARDLVIKSAEEMGLKSN
ncbi:ribonuclease H-like domain-containing protein [Tanacetum coccineum]